jgi:hypothetical protein
MIAVRHNVEFWGQVPFFNIHPHFVKEEINTSISPEPLISCTQTSLSEGFGSEFARQTTVSTLYPVDEWRNLLD